MKFRDYVEENIKTKIIKAGVKTAAKMYLAKKIKAKKNEGNFVNYSEEERGKTSKDKGHSHTYFFKRMTGDGGTSKDAGHLHKIKAMVIQKVDGHDHDMK